MINNFYFLATKKQKDKSELTYDFLDQKAKENQRNWFQLTD